MPDEKPVPVHRQKYPELVVPRLAPSLPIDLGIDESVHLLDYWRIVLAHRWTVLAVFLTVVIATMIWTFKREPTYEATLSIQIDRENPNVLSFKDIYQVESSEDDALRTQFEVLKSRTLAR